MGHLCASPQVLRGQPGDPGGLAEPQQHPLCRQ